MSGFYGVLAGGLRLYLRPPEWVPKQANAFNRWDVIAEMPKVSVIIPSYNCEPYIAATLDSVLNQSFKDIELIVVDDGSTDRTVEIVSSYGAPVRLITQTNARVCAARNRGIREARGEFVCLMDHDDYWFPEKLARQLQEFESNPEIGVVYSSFINWHANGQGQFPRPGGFDVTVTPDDVDPEFSGWIYHLFLLDCWMLTSTAMFRSTVFKACGGFDEGLPFSEDWELWFRISRQFKMSKLRRATTLYRQHHLQGNKIVREVDYRTVLLEQTARQWGYCSRDGRCVPRRQFLDQLASYHLSFAAGHLQYGRRVTALRSLLKAWWCSPQKLKYLAFVPLAALGWTPKW